MVSAATKKSAGYDRDNHQAALIILTDPDGYGGEEALAVIWARKYVEAQQCEARPRHALFQMEAA